MILHTDLSLDVIGRAQPAWAVHVLIIHVATCMTCRAEDIMLINLGIILLSNSHNFAYYAHRFHLLFSK